MGATEYDPITKRGDTGFVTASVIDPFGNILGIMWTYSVRKRRKGHVVTTKEFCILPFASISIRD